MRKLHYGDNLDILQLYGYDESVDLGYFDPPFSSAQKGNEVSAANSCSILLGARS
jgi:hypothetical protein